MKEAAGEANMTVITIVLIGVVAAVGLALVPSLMKNIKKRSCCTDAGGVLTSGSKGARCTDNGNSLYDYTAYSNCYQSVK